MDAINKAQELIKISFEPLAKMTGFKPARKDMRNLFNSLERHSKYVAKQFIREIIKEVDVSQKEYWNEVDKHIDRL